MFVIKILFIFGYIVLYCQGQVNYRPHFQLGNGWFINGRTYLPTFSQTFYSTVDNLCVKDYDFANNGYNACFLGIWTFYNEIDFKGSFENFSSRTIKCGFYSTFNDPNFKSVRLIGTESDFRNNSVTFFDGTSYVGGARMFTENTSVYNTLSRSLILTGDSDLEIFLEEEYLGFSICVKNRVTNDIVTYIEDIANTYFIPPEAIRSFQFTNC